MHIRKTGKGIVAGAKDTVYQMKSWPAGRKAAWMLGAGLFVYWLFCLPATLFTAPTSYVLYDRQGRLLSASIAADGQWRFPAPQSLPSKFVDCITTYEDKRFFGHKGVDLLAVARAVGQRAAGGQRRSGASTLSMQVMRLQQKHRQRHLGWKLVETFMALRLELGYSKGQILALYAGHAPFGSNVVGIDAAAWRYYGRPAQGLSWGEMAALCVLPNAPGLVHPGKNRHVLLAKRNHLLALLQARRMIDSTTAALAMLEPLPLKPLPLPQAAPHLLQRFKRDYAAQAGQMHASGTASITTIDAVLQQQVAQVLQQHAAPLRGQQIRNAAALVIDISSGELLSYIGNHYQPADSALESHVDVLAAPRSPGSTLKPLLYAAMINEGLMLPAQLWPDVPTQIGSYHPQNFDLSYDGAVPAHQALARSLNVPAVKMLQQYKYQRFYNLLRREGFTTLTQPADFYGLSLILGGGEVNALELAAAYARLVHQYQQGPAKKQWQNIRYLKTAIHKNSAIPDRAYTWSQTAIGHMLMAMNEVMRPGEEGLWGSFQSAQRIAWKTGTSFGFRDGWALGMSSRYLVLVWVGNTTGEGSPALVGLHTAAPILFQIFRSLPQAPPFASVGGPAQMVNTCKQSGYASGPHCSLTEQVAMPAKAAPGWSQCPFCRQLNLDESGSMQVNAACLPPWAMRRQPWFVLPPAMEFYYRQSHPAYVPMPAFAPGCAAENTRTLDVIYPQENARIKVPLEIDGTMGKAVFSATHRQPWAKLFWHVDDAFVATTEQFHQLALAPAPGPHTLVVMDESGNEVRRHFTIADP